MEKILDGVKKTSIGNNKFDYQNALKIYGSSSDTIREERINNGITLTSLVESQWLVGCYVVGEVEDLIGETLYVVCDLVFSNPNNEINFALIYCDENGANRETIVGTKEIKDGKLTGQWGKIESGANRKYVAVRLYVNIADDYAIGDFAEYNNLMISTFKPTQYEPYTEQNEYLETVYINGENVYVQDEIVFNKLVDKILGFEYWDVDTGNTYILPSSMSGDVLKLTYENQDYYTIEQFEELNFLGVWQGAYKLQIDSGLQQETKVVGINTQVKAIKVTVNRLDNTLQLAVTDISTQKDTTSDLLTQIQANEALITQTANEINQTVTEITGQLNDNIDASASDLKQITDALEQQIITNQALIKTLSDSITSTIKTTGGNNLLRNSVGLADTDFWEIDGDVNSSQDGYTEQNTESGSKFVLTNSSSLKQFYTTKVGTTYGVSFKLRHIVNGTANAVYVRVHRTETDYDEILVDAEQTTAYNSFQEFNEYTYVASTTQPYIEIINTGDDVLEISDLIISIGGNQSWSGYHDEVYGKEHRLDKYGLKLTDLASGNNTSVTNTSIKLTTNNEVGAELSKTQVKSDSGYLVNKLQVRRLQMVALDDDNIVEYV